MACRLSGSMTMPSLRGRCLFLEPVRWLGQSHRIAHQLLPNVNPLDTAKGQNKHWAEFTLCQHRRGKALGRNHIVQHCVNTDKEEGIGQKSHCVNTIDDTQDEE